MKVLRPALVALVFCAPLLASAQWMWVDKDGKKVFSDRPPPSDVAQDRILKQPGARGKSVDTTPAAAPAPVAAATDAAPARPQAGTDKSLEDKRKQAAAAEAEKRKAEEAKIAAIQADNCQRAKTAKAGLDAGYRIAQTNAKGEREIMDDTQRAAEAKRLEAVITRDCR